MQIAVRLRREACHDALVAAGGEIGTHDVANEILTGFAGGRFGECHAFGSKRCASHPAEALIASVNQRAAPGLDKFAPGVKCAELLGFPIWQMWYTSAPMRVLR